MTLDQAIKDLEPIKDFYATMPADAILELLRQAKRDAEIVAKLPKTADGVTMVPGTPVYFWWPPLQVKPGEPCQTEVSENPYLKNFGPIASECCYSTREAAEAAKNAESKK